MDGKLNNGFKMFIIKKAEFVGLHGKNDLRELIQVKMKQHGMNIKGEIETRRTDTHLEIRQYNE